MLSALFSPRGLHVQGYLSNKKHPPPWDHHRSLGIGLLQCPTGGGVLMSEVPMNSLKMHMRRLSISCVNISPSSIPTETSASRRAYVNPFLSLHAILKSARRS